MIEQVIYTPEADDEVAESYDWYQSCEPGLGEEFLRCIEACLLTIQRHPHLFPVALDEFRRAPIRRFPYDFLRARRRLHHRLFGLSLFPESAEVAEAPRSRQLKT